MFIDEADRPLIYQALIITLLEKNGPITVSSISDAIKTINPYFTEEDAQETVNFYDNSFRIQSDGYVILKEKQHLAPYYLRLYNHLQDNPKSFFRAKDFKVLPEYLKITNEGDFLLAAIYLFVREQCDIIMDSVAPGDFWISYPQEGKSYDKFVADGRTIYRFPDKRFRVGVHTQFVKQDAQAIRDIETIIKSVLEIS